VLGARIREQGLKPRFFWARDAALKRRSTTAGLGREIGLVLRCAPDDVLGDRCWVLGACIREAGAKAPRFLGRARRGAEAPLLLCT
jgi:hypothetical protein